MDLISDLPDCLIAHILSCLPAKDAVRTCVLSKFWEYKWNSIYNICVNDVRNVAKFLDGILLNVQHIRSVNLRFYEIYDASRIDTWVSTIFSHNVESVAILYPKGYGPVSIILTPTLLNCTSLRILKFHICCTLKVSVNTCFVNLTSLNLKDVRIRNDNPNTDMLKLDFPVLETLVLDNCEWLNMSFVEFCAPTLRFFEVNTYDLKEGDKCIIQILGERLAEFRSLGCDLRNLILVGSTVVRAILDNDSFIESDSEENEVVFAEEGLKIRRLLNGFSNLEDLILQAYVVIATAHTKSVLPLTKYDKLQRLAISGDSYLDYTCDMVGALFELLHAAPFLKLLDIDVIDFYPNAVDFDYEAMVPLAVPSCIVSHLEEVHLERFSGDACEFHLVAFLLANGAKLKKLTISLLPPYELVQELSGLPKASASITIAVN